LVVVGIQWLGDERWTRNGSLTRITTLNRRRKPLATENNGQPVLGAGFDSDLHFTVETRGQWQSVQCGGQLGSLLSDPPCPSVDDPPVFVQGREIAPQGNVAVLDRHAGSEGFDRTSLHGLR